MKVGIIGFGKTGQAVASVLLESKEYNLLWIIRNSKELQYRSASDFLNIKSNSNCIIYSRENLTAAELLNYHSVDLIIDFSSENGIDYYGIEAARRNITIITAISNYSDQKLKFLKSLSKQTCILSSPNITIGINFLILSAKILQKIAPYTDIAIIEEHFKDKSEVSGTAKIITRELGISDKKIKSIRAGGIIGIHEIIFGFPFQTIRLKHESITRKAFGNGIIFAIENLKDKSNGLYSMEELLIPYFNLAQTKL